jgi:hypothetical protein
MTEAFAQYLPIWRPYSIRPAVLKFGAAGGRLRAERNRLSLSGATFIARLRITLNSIVGWSGQAHNGV